MSLLQVFSQVLMLEAEVSDSALANIRKSADEILVEMKNIEQGVSGGITSFIILFKKFISILVSYPKIMT